MLDLIPAPAAELIPLDRDRAALDLDLAAGKAASTRRAYAADGLAFGTWCRYRGLDPLVASPQTIALHLSSEAARGLSAGSLSRRLAGIAYFLQLGGVADEVLPTRSKVVHEALAGIRRRYDRLSRRKAAATTDIVRAMLDTCAADPQGVRDRALLALGFAGAFRRSELVALDVSDLEEVKDGLRVTIRRSKTDQLGTGYVLPIGRGARLRPVDALQTWLQAANITTGAIFLRVHKAGAVQPQRLTAGMVALIVKRRVELAGFNPTQFSGHSLRAGFVTSAAENGANIFKIADVSRHKSMDVLKGYVRSREMFKDYAGAGIL
jgi:site-specific recombinase XerD